MTAHPNDPGTANDRVRAALDGKFSPSDLGEDEQIIFYDLLAKRHAGSETEFAAELRQEAGNVGYDEDGNLIKTLDGGRIEILKHSD